MKLLRLIPVVLGLCAVLVTMACGPGIDLATSVTLDDVFTGWYDNGVKDGKNYLIPSISFRIKNSGQVPINEIQLTVSFWRDGEDGEWDSKDVSGIGRESVAPGAQSEPVLVRGGVGYTLEAARSEFFLNSGFRDAVAKVFAKRSGKIVPVGVFKLERRIIPQSGTAVPKATGQS